MVARGRIVSLLAFAAIGLTSIAAVDPHDSVSATSGSVASWCRPDTSPAQLDRMFDGDPAGIVGADYPRTVALPDGRVLWTFQDPVVRTSGGDLRNLHNGAVVQDGACFEFLRSGSAANPTAWLLPELTTNERAWFWPMGSVLSGDERTVHVFLAQMFENADEGYLVEAVPNSVVVVNLDADTLAVTGGPFTPSWGVLTASDRTLYGWSAEAAGNWTYLLGHCHRQFGYDPFFNDTFIHDRACTTDVPLARVPRSDIFAPAQYWTGSGWSSNRNAARSLFASSRVDVSQPTQFQVVNGRWMATTKVDDWFGQVVIIDRADKVTGPWERIATIPVTPKCGPVGDDPGCNTYFSSFIDDPGRSIDDPVVVSLSHNRWDGAPSSLYRPTYFTVAPPPHAAALADRCALDQC